MTATVYLPTDEEANEGIGAWVEGASEDLNAYYARKRVEGTDAVSLLTGSVGSTHIALPDPPRSPAARGPWAVDPTPSNVAEFERDFILRHSL